MDEQIHPIVHNTQGIRAVFLFLWGLFEVLLVLQATLFSQACCQLLMAGLEVICVRVACAAGFLEHILLAQLDVPTLLGWFCA